MRHFTLPRFWKLYRQLPLEIQKLADRNYQLLKQDAKHPSLHFKEIGGDSGLWSVRVGLSYRALGRETSNGIVWFWIGTHADYDKILHQ
jgi:hypothetical protein